MKQMKLFFLIVCLIVNSKDFIDSLSSNNKLEFTKHILRKHAQYVAKHGTVRAKYDWYRCIKYCILESVKINGKIMIELMCR